ncbi:MAG: TRAP transporter small permease subunit [Dehalococcoidia bacterium]|nr:TRAP transporter small permease subunit [Dehalococcoidia bacterium]
MKKVFKSIDSISEWGGKCARWFILFMILVILFEVIMRDFFSAPTFWGYEVTLALGASLYAIGFAYTESKHGHVRVDVFYIHMSPRVKAITDSICGFVFFLPAVGVVAFFSYNKMMWSWDILEKSIEGYWYPPWYPLRTIISIGWAMLLLQGLSHLSLSLYHAIKGRAYGT